MCKINCSGGCINCAPEEHIEDLQNELYTTDQLRQAKVEVLRSAADRLMNCGEEFGAKHLLILADEIEKGE